MLQNDFKLYLSTFLSADRPGQCPSTKPPRPCISDSDECEFDGDCYPGKKCCDNTCFTRCLDPVGLGTNTSQSGLGPNIGESKSNIKGLFKLALFPGSLRGLSVVHWCCVIGSNRSESKDLAYLKPLRARARKS